MAETAGIYVPGGEESGRCVRRDLPRRGRASRTSSSGRLRTTATSPHRSGVRLPVDPTRAYSALNYLIQSTSRDVTGRALLRLHDAGFTPYLRLPIHDEILASLPAERAEWGAGEIGQDYGRGYGGCAYRHRPEGRWPQLGFTIWSGVLNGD